MYRFFIKMLSINLLALLLFANLYLVDFLFGKMQVNDFAIWFSRVTLTGALISGLGLIVTKIWEVWRGRHDRN